MYNYGTAILPMERPILPGVLHEKKMHRLCTVNSQTTLPRKGHQSDVATQRIDSLARQQECLPEVTNYCVAINLRIMSHALIMSHASYPGSRNKSLEHTICTCVRSVLGILISECFLDLFGQILQLRK